MRLKVIIKNNIIYITKLLKKFVKICLIKEFKLVFYIDLFNLTKILIFLKTNSFFKLTTLIDINVIDWLDHKKNRFELTYSF
jgi:NADH:ubiquinone oxidoreductase subunit C